MPAPHTYGTDTELNDDDEDHTLINVPISSTELLPVHRYPSREHRPHQKFDDYNTVIRHQS